MNSFADLKKSRQENLEKLTNKIDDQAKKSGFNDPTRDDRFWDPKTAIGKDGTGTARIRFIPKSSENDKDDYVRFFHHFFRTPLGVYGEKSLTTFPDTRDPLYELNGRLYQSGSEKDKEQAKRQRRSISFIANIVVEHNPNAPEQDGKTFLWRFGNQVFEKIEEAIKPKFPGQEPFNPFDMFDGASLYVNIFTRKIGTSDVPNYEKSTFGKSEPLFGGIEAKMEAAWKSGHELSSFVDPNNRDMYKTYDELSARLNRVLGIETNQESAEPKQETVQYKEIDDDIPFEMPGSNDPSPQDNDFDDFFKTLE